MRTKTMAMAAMVLMVAAPAFARKSCDELKSEIDAKLQAKGVKGYTLEIKPNDEAKDLKEGKIVGSCDGGTKKIVYTRAAK
jgi:hypothetical protein